jgi:hypothetical protein
MKTAVKKIYRFQLERLGVIPNDEIHYRLSTWPADATVDDLREAEGWLRGLEAKNGIYQPENLRRTIEQIWFDICSASWSLGPKAFAIYRRSRLRRITPNRLWQFGRSFGRRAVFG